MSAEPLFRTIHLRHDLLADSDDLVVQPKHKFRRWVVLSSRIEVPPRSLSQDLVFLVCARQVRRRPAGPQDFRTANHFSYKTCYSHSCEPSTVFTCSISCVDRILCVVQGPRARRAPCLKYLYIYGRKSECRPTFPNDSPPPRPLG